MNAADNQVSLETLVQHAEPSSELWGWLGRIFALATALLLTGCAGLIPLPSHSKETEAGQVIKRPDADFIVAGKTTRAEVIDRFGSRVRECPRAPAVAYSWELPGGTALWWWFVATPQAAAGDAGEFEWSHWRALFVGFDQNNRVAVAEFVHLSGGKSLDAQLERWASRHALGSRPARGTSGPALSPLACSGGSSQAVAARADAELVRR